MRQRRMLMMRHWPMIVLVFLLLIAPLAHPVRAISTFTVTNTGDSAGVCTSSCSLRSAILAANSTPGSDNIQFNIPGGGPYIINVTTPLPLIFDPVIIDGATQPGFSGAPLIVLNGESIPPATPGQEPTRVGINILSGGVMVRGLVIQGFDYGGIGILSGGNNIIEGNYIGTNAAGTAALPNLYGVIIYKSSNNRVGGALPAQRNIISGNINDGVNIGGDTPMSAVSNTVIGNYIGVDVGGANALGNTDKGIKIETSDNNVIQNNVIAASASHGIYVKTSSSTLIQGNYIGTNAAGSAALGNGGGGGIFLEAATNTLIGSTTALQRNLISGNIPAGIHIASGSTGTTVRGNYIGTDVTGAVALPNGSGSVINYHSGILIDTTATGNTIGGAAPSAGNVISGNNPTGLWIVSGGNTVLGNVIGLQANGAAALGNIQTGLNVASNGNTIGGATTGAGNVIAGNGVNGLLVSSNNNTIQGNFIGVNPTGATNLGNGVVGVSISGSSNTFGGTVAGAGNTVAYNNGPGVSVTAGTGNAVLGNRIYGNDRSGDPNAGLGIDLTPDGLTPNDPGDADSGPNNLQNFPVLTSAATNFNTIRLSGTLNSAASKAYRLEFFANAACDPLGNGEGQVFLGATTVTTNASGNAAFNNITFTAFVTTSQLITATATDPTNNTSEFAACQAVTVDSSPLATPEPNYYDALNTPTLTWNQVTWALGYEIQLATDSAFSNILYDDTTVPPAQLAWTTPALNPGRYYWRVRAKQTAATWGPWSAAQSFVVNFP